MLLLAMYDVARPHALADSFPEAVILYHISALHYTLLASKPWSLLALLLQVACCAAWVLVSMRDLACREYPA